MKIAGIISSKKLGDTNEGHLQNPYQYQGDYSEFDEDIGWNDFALRSYDPQVGRWAQMDPYDEFPSPYTGIGNDPVNNVDPSGGFLGLSPLASVGVSTLGGAIVGTAVDILNGGDGTTGAAIGAGVGLLAGVAGTYGIRAIAGATSSGVSFLVNEVSQQNSIYRTVGYQQSSGFQKLTKEILYNYVQKNECTNCSEGQLQQKTGIVFERLFEDFVKSVHVQLGLESSIEGEFTIVRNKSPEVKFFTDFKNTAPDFFGIKIKKFRDGRYKKTRTTYYNIESLIELKATKRTSIALSTFDNQLKAQIVAAKNEGIKNVTILTTAGVRLGRSLRNFAIKNRIMLRHYSATYKTMHGEMYMYPEPVYYTK